MISDGKDYPGSIGSRLVVNKCKELRATSYLPNEITHQDKRDKLQTLLGLGVLGWRAFNGKLGEPKKVVSEVAKGEPEEAQKLIIEASH